jgi:hypothetical protein
VHGRVHRPDDDHDDHHATDGQLDAPDGPATHVDHHDHHHDGATNSQDGHHDPHRLPAPHPGGGAEHATERGQRVARPTPTRTRRRASIQSKLAG